MQATNTSANLDFLRAYAVLTVYRSHLLQTFHIERVIGRVTIYDLAQTGVLIFFVHTSLVLMLSLERLRIAGWRIFPVFYIRRAFRIYPLSVVTVLVMLAARVPSFPTFRFSPLSWLDVFSNLALTQNLTGSESFPAVLWSLPYEVQMYIVLPGLFLLLRWSSSWWVPIGLWVLAVVAIAVLRSMGLQGAVGFLLYTPCFLGGIVGYYLWSKRRLELPFWGWPLAITACVGLRVVAEATSSRAATTVSGWCACLFLGLAVPQFRELGRGWVRKCASLVARYSYGLYLSHCGVFWIAFVLMSERALWIQGGLCLVLSVLLPATMYNGVEKPMIDLGIGLASASARET